MTQPHSCVGPRRIHNSFGLAPFLGQLSLASHSELPIKFLWFTTKNVSGIKPIVVEHSNSTCAGQTLRKDKGHLSLFLPFLYEGVVQRVEVAMTTTSCVLQVYQYQQQHGLAAIVLSDALELL